MAIFGGIFARFPFEYILDFFFSAGTVTSFFDSWPGFFFPKMEVTFQPWKGLDSKGPKQGHLALKNLVFKSSNWKGKSSFATSYFWGTHVSLPNCIGMCHNKKATGFVDIFFAEDRGCIESSLRGRGVSWRGHSHAKDIAPELLFTKRNVCISHRIHVWYIYLHLVDIYGKCSQIYHAWILWLYDSGWAHPRAVTVDKPIYF